MNHYPLPDISSNDILKTLRDKLFISILLLAFPVCIIAYIPSFIVSILTKQFVIAAFDSAAMALLVSIFLSRKLSLYAKKGLFSLTFYILSALLLFYLGNKGPGLIILICTSVLMTLYQSKKAGLIAVA
jgi:hypothetical protein